jgi:tetratricopeptide (TPR) repeat protein
MRYTPFMQARWSFFLLLAVTLATFAVTLTYPFVFDDLLQIVQNPHIQSWQFFPSYFTDHVWSQDPDVPHLYYRPLFLLQLRLLHALFGLWAPGWHFVLVLLHIASVATVYWLVRQWKSQETALLAAALFAFHPVHAEVVSWISAIAEPAMLIALLGSLILIRRNRPWDRAYSLALYSAALLLKEPAIVWPIVIFIVLYDGFPKTLRRSLPFFAVTIIYLIIRILVLGNIINKPAGEPELSGAYLPTIFCHYFFHLVWPVKLSVYSFLNPSWAYLALALPILAALIWIARRGEYERAAVLILLIPLLPALNPSTFRLDYFVQDRYLYIPSVGFCMLAVLLIERIPKPAIALLLIAMIVGCLYEDNTWSDSEHFYSRGLELSPTNQSARDGLGRAYARDGKYQQAVEILEPLVGEAQPSARRLQQSLMTLAYSYEHLGNLQAAINYYSQADGLYPRADIEAHVIELQNQLAH